MILLSKYIFWM